MSKLISALRRFETTDDIEIYKLPIEAQREMTPHMLYLRDLGYLAAAVPGNYPYPIEVWLLPEGKRKRLELLGI